MISNKVKSMIALMRLDKPIGILLLLWPTLMALWIAGKGSPNPRIVCIFVLGVVLSRSAGCVVNDLVDRKFDKQVTRTRLRPLAIGNIRVWEAAILFMVLLAFSFLCVLYLDLKTIALAGIAAFLFTIYPFMKRYTHWPQAVLGLAFSWGIPMAYSALRVPMDWHTWVLLGANFCWIMAYDTQYAMADRADDLKAGVKSTALLFGAYDCWMIALFQASTLALFTVLGFLLQLGLCYYLSLLLAGALFVYHQVLIRDGNALACFKAFKHNHYVGMVLFLGLVYGNISLK